MIRGTLIKALSERTFEDDLSHANVKFRCEDGTCRKVIDTELHERKEEDEEKEKEEKTNEEKNGFCGTMYSFVRYL